MKNFQKIFNKPSKQKTTLSIGSTCTIKTSSAKLRERLPKVPVYSKNKNGDYQYYFKDDSGHIFFDVCDCSNCLEEAEALELEEEISSPIIINSDYGLLGEPTGKFNYIVKYTRPHYQSTMRTKTNSTVSSR